MSALSGRDHPIIREGLSSQEGVVWSRSRPTRRAPIAAGQARASWSAVVFPARAWHVIVVHRLNIAGQLPPQLHVSLAQIVC